MVNLPEIFLGEWYLKSSLVCGFKDMGWTKLSSIDIRGASCYCWDVAKHRVTEERNLDCSVFVIFCD